MNIDPIPLPPAAAPATQTRAVDAAGFATDFIDLGRILRTLWRGRLFLLIAAVIGSLLAGVYAFALVTPLYRATSVVMLNTREEQVVDLESVMGGLSPDRLVINSEVKILGSRSLLHKVVDELDLMSDPEFNGALRAPTPRERLRALVSGLLTDAGPAGAGPSESRQRAATANALARALTVRNVPTTLLFEVTVTSEDPQKAARIADTVAELYIRDQLAVKFAATEQATGWLSQRVSELSGELEAAEARIAAFSAGTTLISQDTLAGLERQLKDLRDRLAERRGSLAGMTARLTAIDAAATPMQQAEGTGDVALLRLARQGQGDSAAFGTRLAEIRARLQTDIERAAGQIAALDVSVRERARQIRSQSEDLIALQQLTREAEASRLLYEYFLSRLKQTSAQRGIQQADSRVQSAAEVPVSPVSPRKALWIAVGAVAGTLACMGGLLVREARSHTFREARALEGQTGHVVLGQIPLVPARHRRDALEYLMRKPTSVAAEAIRNLRTSVLLSDVEAPPQVIMTTSSLPGEGKTTLSLALAQSFAAMGKRVLLIEGDIRRRVFSEYFAFPAETEGLVSVLEGRASLGEAVVHEAHLAVDVLIGDTSNANAADLFSAGTFAALLDEARYHYDQIIIDTPPVLVVPDARVMSRHCDALLFTVRWDRTSGPQVLTALQMFESVNQKVSGLILNQINPRGLKRYGYGGRQGAYGQYAYGQKYYTN